MNLFQENIKTFQFTDRLLDLVLLFISARGAIVCERLLHSKSWHVLDPVSFHFYALFIIFVVWLVLIQIFESNLFYKRIPLWDIIQNTIFISFIGVTTTITLDFLLGTELFQRSTILFFGIISFNLLLMKRVGVKHFLSFVYQKGFEQKNILIVGSQHRAERLIYEFRENKEYGLNIAAILDPDQERIGQLVAGMRVSGDMSLFKQEIRSQKIHDVFFTLNPEVIGNIDALFRYMNIIGINYHLILDEVVQEKLPKSQKNKPHITNYYGLSMISYYAIEPNNFN